MASVAGNAIISVCGIRQPLHCLIRHAGGTEPVMTIVSKIIHLSASGQMDFNPVSYATRQFTYRRQA